MHTVALHVAQRTWRTAADASGDLIAREPISLADTAYRAGQLTVQSALGDTRKTLGQFMTPPLVANFMAMRALPGNDLATLHILDPAAGTGVLTAAVVSAVLARDSVPSLIVLSLYEIDQRLIPVLRHLVECLRTALRAKGVRLKARIYCTDFLLSRTALRAKPCVDIVIANPPYFKLGRNDPRALAHSAFVHGQPNIYALFMAVCAGLVKPGGRWCFITPRSWTNGAYFLATRRALMRTLSFDAIHTFESRRSHFVDDEILQEAMITWATARSQGLRDIVVSFSDGASDLAESTLSRQPINRVVGEDDARTIVVPDGRRNPPWLDWAATLDTYGLKVSTGPVIAFRANDHLRQRCSNGTVPLLWMQHIKPMTVQWPVGKKREHIVASGETAWMLVPNNTFVIMRRFSPKEDRRRVIAAPYLADSLPGVLLGLENHTNYIYRPGGTVDTLEAIGLAALLNSAVVDAYLRTVAGSTQVNAADLRRMPLPPLATIRAIGRSIQPGSTLAEIDHVVNIALEAITAQSVVAA